MQRIINVSFPRSGHYLTRDVLQNYFGDELKYCRWSDDFEKRPQLCPETNFTMVHDLHLTFPTDLKDHLYLILVRHPMYSLASWRIHHKRIEGNICEDRGITQQKLEFWSKWVNKWVLSEIPNRLIVQYESLVVNPEKTFMRIVEFLSDKKVDIDVLYHAIDRIGVKTIPNTTDKWIGWI